MWAECVPQVQPYYIRIKRPRKKQCMFGGHRVEQIIAPFFVYNEPSILGSKNPQWTQLSDGVDYVYV